MQKLTGTGVALVTPFKADLSVDFGGLAKLIDSVIAGGVNYLVVNGTTGESATLTLSEKRDVLRFVKKQVAGRLPIVFGIGCNNTQEMLDACAQADLEGVDAILSVSPYYNKPSQEGIYRHYLALAEASPVPILLYNVPGRTGSNISAETTLRLAEHPNIIGTKEASGNFEQCMHIARHMPPDFLFISGDDLLTLPMLSFGCHGVISVVANAFPGAFSKLVRHGLRRELDEAKAILFDTFLNLNPLLYEESNPVGIKVVLEMKDICAHHVRLPLVSASENLQQRIAKELKIKN